LARDNQMHRLLCQRHHVRLDLGLGPRIVSTRYLLWFDPAQEVYPLD
jgi:hypothetical protein